MVKWSTDAVSVTVPSAFVTMVTGTSVQAVPLQNATVRSSAVMFAGNELTGTMNSSSTGWLNWLVIGFPAWSTASMW